MRRTDYLLLNMKNLNFQNIVVIVFDVGPNGAERESENGPTFFDEAKKCIEKIILRKVST